MIQNAEVCDWFFSVSVKVDRRNKVTLQNRCGLAAHSTGFFYKTNKQTNKAPHPPSPKTRQFNVALLIL